MAVLAIEDLVSGKWITEIVSVEESSTQVQLGFTGALADEGLLDALTARRDRPIDPTVDDPTRSILLAVSAYGPPMTSGIHLISSGFTAGALRCGGAHGRMARRGRDRREAWSGRGHRGARSETVRVPAWVRQCLGSVSQWSRSA
jgi:hypothetical protein